ncbi:MAG: hypothetical protein ACRESS_05165 [Stenotrophobium sp.]
MTNRSLLLLTLTLAFPAAHAASPQTLNPPQAQAIAASQPNCLRDTGSYIPRPVGKCIPAPGRVYTRDDLHNTGAPTLSGALRELDPSIGSR